MQARKWDRADVILVTGDAYIDSYFDGTAMIGRVLERAGYRVAIISQPDVNSASDIMSLGEPRLFWGVSAGSVDSMVANYTPLRKLRRSDDSTPGGINNRRPDRATIAYTNLIRRHFKKTAPIILGGIEASLRRIAHYDFWSDTVRRSVLVDSKADLLVYGMGEKTILEIAQKIESGEDYRQTQGSCYMSNSAPKDYLELPSYEEVKNDKLAFIKMFRQFYENNAHSGGGMYQKTGNRYVVHNQAQELPTRQELDSYYEMDFERDVHPHIKKRGDVRSIDTVKNSITSHRGCFGECNFCSITVHQGRQIQSRSIESIVREVQKLTAKADFKGIISDIGGASGNMYEMGCSVFAQNNTENFNCRRKCLSPQRCANLRIDHSPQIKLLEKLRSLPGVRKIFMGSGLRYDLVMEDVKNGKRFFEEILLHHVSGQLKIAPEHVSAGTLKAMGKSSKYELATFIDDFNRINKKHGLKQYLTYYFMADHPGCTMEDMNELKEFIRRKVKMNPEQIQIFTPTPSTYSSAMYYTGLDPFLLEPVFSEKSEKKKDMQKKIILY